MTNEVAGASPHRGIIDEEQPKFPWKPGLGLLFGGAGWYWAGQAVNAVLLPAKIGQIDPDGKVAMVAIVSTVTMIISIIAGIVGGALSDMTRSRFGSRTPWIVGGVIVGSIALLCFAFTGNVAVVLVSWWVYAAVYNAMLAAGCAWQPDQVAPRWRGTASSMYGVGHQAALQGAQVVAALFVTNIPTGVIISLVIGDVLSLISVAVCREPSNKDMPREKFTVGSALSNFLPPKDGGRDYWLAAMARFLWMVPGGIGTYRLYTLTDYMGQSEADAGKWMSFMALLAVIAAVSCGVIAGPISDKFRSVKIPLAIAIFTVGLPCWLPFFVPTPVMYTIYVAISSLGSGVFSSLDQAIMTTVLPNPKTAAKDLAFLNSCGVVGNLTAPLLAGWVIHTFGYAGLFPMGFIVLSSAAICVFFIRKVR
ncbi:multidrug-efflux transporter [Bifidobacterium margollesii]|uniref:Multidrug-efflux transporter n=1 Tax=Bifidobacterium margollesii TaxID=2020964 RepID=A0A2N5JBS4_9BIFI|nr:MFS transporter [Bifidobacterium margollesii]PLS31654.1 multidrug-efflux transporter [Bifidobacterium margollesii]